MTNKLVSLADAASLVPDAATITIGGTLLQRTPTAFVRELARQGRRGLHLVKPSPGYDGDLLSAAGVLARISAGMVSLEQPHGIATGFRLAVERGDVEVIEHACITVASAMRAASLGIPFLPIAGLTGSDVTSSPGFLQLKDPDTGETVWAVRAIRPDVAILHVSQSDERGNARIAGSPNWDALMAAAAEKVILTTEELVPHETLAELPELTTIHELNVVAVVHQPRGAWPGGCHPHYTIDHDAVREYKRVVREPAALQRYLSTTAECDHAPSPSGQIA